MDTQRLNTLRYHLQRAAGQPSADENGHWTKIGACLNELLAATARAEDLSLRTELGKFQVHLARGIVPPNLVPLKRALDIALAARPSSSRPKVTPPTAVEQVARLLRGRAILVIGGTPSAEHAESWRSSFELAEVLWPKTQEGNPRVDPLEPFIARADVALVVLLIRFIRHALNEVVPLCKKHDKPLVRVPSGYSVEQIAPHIIDQCGRRLGA